MALSQPVTLFGIHEVTPYNRSTGLPYGILRVLAGSSLSLSGEIIKLMGGSSPYPWAAENGVITAEMGLKVKELPSWMFNLFLGGTVTDTVDDPGKVSTLTNTKGTSVVATTGIASVGVKTGSEADLKFGAYIVKAVSATTVDVFGVTDVDSNRGVAIEFIDDALKLTSSPLTIATTTAVTVPNLGVELTGDSGTIALVDGDTAVYEATPPSTLLTEITVGALASNVPEFGAFVTAQKQADGSMWLFDVYRLKALGLPLGMEEKAYGDIEITSTMLYDSAKDGLFSMRRVTPS